MIWGYELTEHESAISVFNELLIYNNINFKCYDKVLSFNYSLNSEKYELLPSDHKMTLFLYCTDIEESQVQGMWFLLEKMIVEDIQETEIKTVRLAVSYLGAAIKLLNEFHYIPPQRIIILLISIFWSLWGKNRRLGSKLLPHKIREYKRFVELFKRENPTISLDSVIHYLKYLYQIQKKYTYLDKLNVDQVTKIWVRRMYIRPSIWDDPPDYIIHDQKKLKIKEGDEWKTDEDL